MTLSRNLTDNLTIFFNLAQSTFPSVTNFERFMLPRLQDSNGNRGCSPHGLVDSICPICGVGLNLFIVSIKITPGSPFFHAIVNIKFQIALAFSVFRGLPFLGLRRSNSLSLS